MIKTRADNYAFFYPPFLYELIDQLTIFLSANNLREVTVDFIMSNPDGIINKKFMIDSIIIDYALHFLCDEQPDGSFKLNNHKVIKNLSLAMLYIKGDFYLTEYIQAIK
jgi:hypothetical protein